MKTAVSVPDDIFLQADQLADKMKTSRSALYARALREFLARHNEHSLTSDMNTVVATLNGAPLDDFGKRAANSALQRVEW
jgi:metal-responsive CopG/Arc/MetJ family transcriptional regulator